MTQHKRRQFLKATGVAGAAGLGSMAGCLGLGGGGGGMPTVNFNYVVPVENIASLMAIPEVQDALDHVGNDYKIEVTHNSSTPDSVNAMAAGNADVILTTTVSWASAVLQEAVPEGVTNVGIDFWDAHPDWYSISIFAAPDSGITKPADLKGKTLAVNALGTGIHAVYRKGLRQAGLTEDDVQYTEIPFPTFTSALKEGKVDAGVYPAFFAVGARSAGFTKVFDSSDLWDSAYPFAYATAANRAINNKSEAIRWWTEDYAQLFEYARNNRTSVVEAAAKHFGLPAAVIKQFFLTHNDYYRSVRIDMGQLQTIIDDLESLGFIDQAFDVSEYATNKFLP